MRPTNEVPEELKGNHTWTREGGYVAVPAPEPDKEPEPGELEQKD